MPDLVVNGGADLVASSPAVDGDTVTYQLSRNVAFGESVTLQYLPDSVYDFALNGNEYIDNRLVENRVGTPIVTPPRIAAAARIGDGTRLNTILTEAATYTGGVTIGGEDVTLVSGDGTSSFVFSLPTGVPVDATLSAIAGAFVDPDGNDSPAVSNRQVSYNVVDAGVLRAVNETEVGPGVSARHNLDLGAVDGQVVAGDVTIEFDWAATHVEYTDLVLIAPSGVRRSVHLADGTVVPGDPVTYTFTDLLGEPASGVWTVVVTDGFGGVDTYLRRSELTVAVSAPPSLFRVADRDIIGLIGTTRALSNHPRRHGAGDSHHRDGRHAGDCINDSRRDCIATRRRNRAIHGRVCSRQAGRC